MKYCFIKTLVIFLTWLAFTIHNTANPIEPDAGVIEVPGPDARPDLYFDIEGLSPEDIRTRIALWRSKHRAFDVKGVEDFVIHTVAHIRRVGLLAEDVLTEFPAEFEIIDRELFRMYIGLHDQSKVNFTFDFYRRHQPRTDRPHIIYDLFEGYGESFENLPPGVAEQRKAVRAELNRIDQRVAEEFFSSERFTRRYGAINSDSWTRATREFHRLELIADHVDRVTAPISREEFGRAARPLSETLKNDDLRIANRLQRRWSTVTQGYQYQDLRWGPLDIRKCAIREFTEKLGPLAK